ncbi:hypothetical protein BGZ63DRAFT_74660 [Mariannaea sp. PMI_226]|nr:hypothetical protein BGZ63DRAFT_74660 [Mariannaea sp. PMI_226]
MAQTATTPHLTGLPVEILLDIHQHLDLDSVFSFVASHRAFYNLFRERKATILLPILAREFSPFDELLQVYTASAEDLDATGGQYTPRRVIFKRFFADSGTVLAPQHGGFHSARVNASADSIDAITAQKSSMHPITVSKTVILTEDDLGPLLKCCRIVRRWEERLPQMRWFYEPENCRLLRAHEARRFRGAFYRWWLYGFYFHGDLPRPRVGLPEPFVDDVRISQMRRHSTTELVELMDLVETMKDVVLHYLCPRLDPSQSSDTFDSPLIDTVDRPQSLLSGWADQSRWGRIVKTYAKLGPKELMHLFDNIYSYPRNRLIVEARLHQPNLTLDQESIQVSIRCALDERGWMEKMPSLPEDSAGGIIDFDDERDEERLAFSEDGSPDGSLPLGAKFVRSFSHYSPRGDDGSFLEDLHRQSWTGGRVIVPSVHG